MGFDLYQFTDKTEFFPTKEWVRDLLYEMMPADVHTILDPCAGELGLEYSSSEKSYNYTLLDINPRQSSTIQADFLKWTSDEKFDAVVVNPPFNLTKQFVDHCFEFSDKVFLIAPTKTVLKNYSNYIEDIRLDWRIPYECFGILTSCGLFYLNRNRTRKFSFGIAQTSDYEAAKKKYFYPKSQFGHFTELVDEEDHLSKPDKPFIVVLMTKGRVLRNEQLIQEQDIHEAGDDSVFITKAANINVPIGSRVKRNIIYFDTVEEAHEFKKRYDDNEDYVRNYCYQYGNTILRMCEIPIIPDPKLFVLNKQKNGFVKTNLL